MGHQPNKKTAKKVKRHLPPRVQSTDDSEDTRQDRELQPPRSSAISGYRCERPIKQFSWKVRMQLDHRFKRDIPLSSIDPKKF